MTRIVVGFDDSDESRDALRLGRDLARAEDAELEVAAALSNAPLEIGVDYHEDALEERFDQLFGHAERELGEVGFGRRELRDSSPARALTELAEAEDPEMLVVGSTHRGAIGRVLPGSVGERLLTGSPCPVAVAPRGYGDREHFGLGVIAVAFDGTAEAKLALHEARRLALRLGAVVRLVGVVPPVHDIPARIGHTAPGYARALEAHFREALDGAAAGLVGELTVETLLQHGDPAATLEAQGVEVDLLVIGSRGYGPFRRALLGGVAAEVMRTAPCPVIVVPRASAGR
jgi:nucleotide-binding universal stress UspA family protein